MKKIVLLTAISGSGKSTAAQSLVEEGYVILENIESDLTTKVMDMLLAGDADKIAIVIKLTQKEQFEKILEYINNVQPDYDTAKILITSEKSVIINRYQEKRKVHPLVAEQKVKTLSEAIDEENAIVEKHLHEFDKIIDTSQLASRDMQNYLCSYIQTEDSDFRIIFQSFGFKYGIPKDSDNVIDVRHLPNPYYVKELRKKTGKDSEVQEYVMSFDESKELFNSIVNFLKLQFAGYIKEKRLVVTISIGCTGGQHRSVTFVEKLAQEFENSEIKHLEMDRNNWKI